MSDPWTSAYNKSNGDNGRWLLLAGGIFLSLVLVVIGIVVLANTDTAVRPTIMKSGLIDDVVVAPTALPAGAPPPAIVDDSNALPPKDSVELSATSGPRGWPSPFPSGAPATDADKPASSGQTASSATPQGWPAAGGIVAPGGSTAGTSSTQPASEAPAAWPWPFPKAQTATAPATGSTSVSSVTTWGTPKPATTTSPTPVTPSAGTTAGTKRLSSLAYGTDPLQTMDIYWREGVTNAPVIYLVHGGSSDVGDKSRMRDRALMYQNWGAVVVVPNYRYGAGDVGHPLSGNDVACGLATAARKMANYGGDANKIVVHGFSYGGHISSFVLYDQAYPWLRGCAIGSLSGVVRGFIGESSNYGDPMPQAIRDAAVRTADPARRAEILAPYDIYADTARVMDGAINYIDAKDAPAILLHGGKDPTYDAKRSVDFAEALEDAGVGSLIYVDDDQGHGMHIDTTPELETELRKAIDRLFMGSR